MPKVVDHQQRRGQIAAAVQRLVTSDGLDAVTVARVAGEAGISVGQLQHYFASKEELLEQTYRRVINRMGERVASTRAASIERQLPIRDVVLAGLCERLPLDAARSSDHQVALAFMGHTAANPELTALHARTLTSLRDQIAQAVHNGKECGEVPPDSAPRPHADRLLALTDGLALHLHAMPDHRGTEVVELLAEQVAEVFPGKCRQWVG